MEGCEVNPTSEDLWLETARAALSAKADVGMCRTDSIAQPVRHIPTSIRI